MSFIDWIILSITLLSIVGYGVWKSRHTKSIEGYLLADRQLPWYHVGLSVMATQASAISSPAKALMVYVTDTNGTFTSAGLWIYTTSWKLIIAE